MTYDDFIQNIINTRGQWNIPDGEYYEVHHILPKALGGLPKRTGKKSKHLNIIWLTGREHFIAHKLLSEENKNNIKITEAFWRMCHTKNCNYEITAEEYEEARKLHADIMRTKFLGEANPSRGKSNQHCLGKHWHLSEEAKEKHRQARLGYKMSEETKQKLSKSKTGQKYPNKKKPTKEQIAKRLATIAITKPYCKKILCIELNKIFDSCHEAAAFANIAQCTLSNHLNGRGPKTAGGYHWKYYIDQDK